MTPYRRGEVIVVGFEFSDASGVKRRPALVVSSDGYHKGRREVIVAAITSNVRRTLYGDHQVSRWREAGLLFPSTVTGIVRTIRADMILRRLGTVASEDMDAIDRKLRASLAL